MVKQCGRNHPHGEKKAGFGFTINVRTRDRVETNVRRATLKNLELWFCAHVTPACTERNVQNQIAALVTLPFVILMTLGYDTAKFPSIG